MSVLVFSFYKFVERVFEDPLILFIRSDYKTYDITFHATLHADHTVGQKVVINLTVTNLCQTVINKPQDPVVNAPTVSSRSDRFTVVDLNRN